MVKPARPSKPVAPGRILLQAADARQSGALVIDASPGGTVYLIDGAVTYAESPAAPGVGELLTASGRLSPRTWEAALESAGEQSRVGSLLVEQGHLTRGELELAVLGTIYDAAYFALRPATAPVDFRTDSAHWLGPVIRVDASALAREARRRGRLLDDIFPHPEIDTVPVTPSPRPPVERVTLTALQWELLVHADGQRTPADLAQLLGRAGYATLLQLRELARRGLLELPVPAEPDERRPTFVRLPRARGPSVDIGRPATNGLPAGSPSTLTAAAPATPEFSATGSTPAAPAAPRPAAHAPATPAEEPAANGNGLRPPRLPRRRPNAKLPKGLPDDDVALHTGADEVLLRRIRTALRALR